MRKLGFTLLLGFVALLSWAQTGDALSQLKANPKKAYGTDLPYQFVTTVDTKAPRGYKPFYISHYGRHGSRYYWNSQLYKDLDTLMTAAREKQLLTPEGERFYEKFMAARQELMTGASELTQLGWEQHQQIARRMYNQFTDVFKKGGYVLAISSLSGRCVLSMSAFCQELVQCNPNIEIREQSSRFTLDGVVPDDRQNPAKRNYPMARPRYMDNRDSFKHDDLLPETVVKRTFISTEGLPGDMHKIGSDLVNLYTSLPNIYHEGMMGNLLTEQEIVDNWEVSNLGTYSWIAPRKNLVCPILKDILKKAQAVLDGSSNHIADLHFGHDSYLGPLTILMGINGSDLDPEDPNDVKNCYQNWNTCMASNIQLVFYRGKKATDDILVKCLLNGEEAVLPVPTTQAPYYRWKDFCDFYTKRCQECDALITD